MNKYDEVWHDLTLFPPHRLATEANKVCSDANAQNVVLSYIAVPVAVVPQG